MITDAPPSKPVRLEVDGEGLGRLLVGDEDISSLVNEVTIVARVGRQNLVVCGCTSTAVRVEIGSPTLALIADGHRHLKLHDAERAALVSLGWTPPTQDSDTKEIR